MILTLDSLKEGQIGIVKRVLLNEKKQAKLSHLVTRRVKAGS